MKFIFTVLLTLLGATMFKAFCSGIISGPSIAWTSHREAAIWIETEGNPKETILYYSKDTVKNTYSRISALQALAKDQTSSIYTLIAGELEMNTTYYYYISIDGKIFKGNPAWKFTTSDLWEWRKPAPDFSFIFGSCFYLNDSLYDRPGKPYGQNTSIFNAMAKVKADFNLLGGDNVYLREADLSSASGIRYRYRNDRSNKAYSLLLNARPNYAIWDDHDYGPNDSHKYFGFKEQSSLCFRNYFPAPNYAKNDGSIYRLFSYSDVDFFLMDDRFYRDPNEKPDSANGQINTGKSYWGTEQLTWLKEQLMQSKASFKIIVNGNQVLNPHAHKECLHNYSYEYYDLISFLTLYKIPGILFLSGDRHFSELIKFRRSHNYPLYDFTCSAVTSGIHNPDKNELENPLRVPNSLILQNNFSHISISGAAGERILKIVVYNNEGKELFTHSVNQKELTPQ